MNFEKLEAKKLNNYASIFGGRIANPVCTLAEITVTPNGNSKDAEEQEDPDGIVVRHDGTILDIHPTFVELRDSPNLYGDVWLSATDASVQKYTAL